MKSRLVIYTSVLIALAFLVMTVNSQTINLQLQGDYTLNTGAATPRFAIGDLNRDGYPDIVGSTGVVGQPVSVLLNNGSGGMGAPALIGATLNATAVTIGDFNNDRNPDLAISSVSTGSGVNIRLGDGSGAFPNGSNTAVVDSTVDIATADFNHDGNLDLVVATPQTNAVKVLLGTGTGSFGTPTSFPVGSAPLDIDVADFNSDGRPDMAVVAFTTTNTVTILLNNGSGSFTNAPGISWPNATSAAKVVAGDFNRDCITDLAVNRTDSIAILIGNNSGGFNLSAITVSNSPVALAIGDFNLDRKVDLAVGRLNGFVIFPGNGGGSFDTAAAYVLSANSITDHIGLLDANRDGRMDLALSRRSNNFSLYNDVSSYFLRTESDYDRDGRADLAVFRPSDGNWYLMNGTQGLSSMHWGVTEDRPVAGDFDGDLKADVAVWRESGLGDPNRSYFFILRSSDFTAQVEQFGRAGDLPGLAGDWDGDGRTDVAVYRAAATAGAQSYFFYRPSSVVGSDFTAVPWGTNGDRSVRGDFDGDGRQDAAVFRPSNGTWYILRSSNGQVRYQSFGSISDQPVSADYDGDRSTDIAVFRPSNNVWYILNSASGTVRYATWGLGSDSLVPGDYNGDGIAEVAVYRPSDQHWYVPPCATFPGIDQKFGASGDIAVQALP